MLLAVLFACGLLRVCFSCRAAISAEHSARFVFVFVAGLTELTLCFTPAQQNLPQGGLLGSTLLSGALLGLPILLRGLLGLLLLLRGPPLS